MVSSFKQNVIWIFHCNKNCNCFFSISDRYDHHNDATPFGPQLLAPGSAVHRPEREAAETRPHSAVVAGLPQGNTSAAAYGLG